MMSEKIKAILSELRQRFESLYGERLAQMVLFGSQARGDAEDGSDIDVLVVLRGPVHPGEEIARTGEIKAKLSLRYDVVVSCVYLSVDRYSTEQSPLLLNVRREGVSI